jgi:hypothetical protein
MASLSDVIRCCITLGIALPVWASAADHDIHFLSEHAPESAMDAHYLSLPWPSTGLEPGEWGQSLDLSVSSTRTEFIDVEGPMIAFAAAKGTAHAKAYELLGFYSDMDVSGSGGRSSLDLSFMPGMPLDVPAPADFGQPRGAFRQFGFGATLIRNWHGRAASTFTQLSFGALVERAEAAGFQLDYRLAGGADAGATGVLDHSSRATFLTALVAWQQTRRLAKSWAWSPRALLAYPLPPGDFDARLTGSGFELTTQSTGSILEIGDPFLGLGLAIAHVPTGLEIDLGGSLFFAAAEHLSHDGVDRALVLHVAWRRRPNQAVR